MRPYAERPARALLQVLADLIVVAWVVVVVKAATASRDLILQLQAPGVALTDAGNAVRTTFTDAANVAREVPFVGGALADALGMGTDAGTSLVGAGEEQIAAVATGAYWAMVGIIVIGALPTVLLWIAVRVRWMRAAASARAVRVVDTDLLALRALTRRPVRKLLKVCPDPASAWRHDDRGVVRSLAALELRSLGLKVPPTSPD